MPVHHLAWCTGTGPRSRPTTTACRTRGGPPDGRRGRGYSSLVQTDPNAAIYRYPNAQPATTLWFHDHTLGMTRISVLSGLAGMYFVRDQYDTGAASNPLGLPAGNQEIERVLQDRQFDTNGQWYFPDSSSNGQGLNGDPTNPLIHPNWIPEYFGDALVATQELGMGLLQEQPLAVENISAPSASAMLAIASKPSRPSFTRSERRASS